MIRQVAFSALEVARGRPSPITLRAIRSRMSRDGVVVFENLFSNKLLGSLRDEFVRLSENPGFYHREFVRLSGNGRIAVLVPFQGAFLSRAFYAHPILIDVVRSLLGGDFCIGSLEAVVTSHGAKAQAIHSDGGMLYDARESCTAALLPPYAVTLAIPLCDLKMLNGPTEIWPGSHRSDRSADILTRKLASVHIVGPMGMAYLFDYRTLHRGLANTSWTTRPLLTLIFTRSWYRDHNLNHLTRRIRIKDKDLARVPRRLKWMFRLANAG